VKNRQLVSLTSSDQDINLVVLSYMIVW